MKIDLSQYGLRLEPACVTDGNGFKIPIEANYKRKQVEEIVSRYVRRQEMGSEHIRNYTCRKVRRDSIEFH